MLCTCSAASPRSRLSVCRAASLNAGSAWITSSFPPSPSSGLDVRRCGAPRCRARRRTPAPAPITSAAKAPIANINAVVSMAFELQTTGHIYGTRNLGIASSARVRPRSPELSENCHYCAFLGSTQWGILGNPRVLIANSRREPPEDGTGLASLTVGPQPMKEEFCGACERMRSRVKAAITTPPGGNYECKQPVRFRATTSAWFWGHKWPNWVSGC